MQKPDMQDMKLHGVGNTLYTEQNWKRIQIFKAVQNCIMIKAWLHIGEHSIIYVTIKLANYCIAICDVSQTPNFLRKSTRICFFVNIQKAHWLRLRSFKHGVVWGVWSSHIKFPCMYCGAGPLNRVYTNLKVHLWKDDQFTNMYDPKPNQITSGDDQLSDPSV